LKAVRLSNFCINGVRKSLPETRLHLAFLNIPLVHKLWLRARKKKGKKKQNKTKSNQKVQAEPIHLVTKTPRAFLVFS